MKDIKKIIAENLIALRKKHNLTQNELAQKLNYSDNTVSRWERAELCPTIETLQEISDVYSVPLEMLIKENALKQNEAKQKSDKIKVLVLCLLCISLILFAVTIAYFYLKSFVNLNLWILFVWVAPASFCLLYGFGLYLKERTFTFIMLTLFIWTFLASFYLQFLKYNLWLIFTLGVPAQIAWTIWCYVRPRPNKKEKN